MVLKKRGEERKEKQQAIESMIMMIQLISFLHNENCFNATMFNIGI